MFTIVAWIGGGQNQKVDLTVALNGLYQMHCWRGWESHLTLFVPESRDWPCHSELLEIFNCSFATGTSPTIWKSAVILPLKKAGKQPGAIVSYRPVSLASCVAKTMERICIYIYIYMYKGSGTYPCALLSRQFLTVENTKKNTSA